MTTFFLLAGIFYVGSLAVKDRETQVAFVIIAILNLITSVAMYFVYGY